MTAGARVRPMRREDVDAVLVLTSDEPTAPHWPPFEYLRMLKVIAAEPARRGAWVVDMGQRLSGVAIASHVAGVCELEAVVVAPGARRQGLGSLLVQEAADWGRTLGAERLQLEVRASNEGALRLYILLGFSLDGRRVGYYHNPLEDAVLLSLQL